MELDYLRDVERAHKLPTGVRQGATAAGDFLDVHYDEYATIVELDGRAFHERRAFRDRERDNRNALAHATTLRYGYDDLMADPCAIALEVAEVLISRGWGGTPQRCRRCLK